MVTSQVAENCRSRLGPQWEHVAGQGEHGHPSRQVEGEPDAHAVPGAGTPAVPAHVEYCLSSLGRTLLEPLEAFGAGAAEHGAYVREARDRAKEPGPRDGARDD
ncbi:hypothetical protein [Streptomyces sp. NPDC060333]|uniref:hypothetical protein n=1 Tax=Streptomyces sp. NPDC060333 TaxID=3347098 RepID=UPI0036614E03